MFYIDRMLDSYSRNDVLFNLSFLSKKMDFVAIKETAVCLYCGYPVNKISVMSEISETITINSVNIEVFGGLSDKKEVFQINGIKVETLKELFNADKWDDLERYSRLIHEMKIPSSFIGQIDKKNLFMEAYENIYGMQNREFWKRHL